MNEIYLIIRNEWGKDSTCTYVKDIVGMYNTEEEALSDVGRLMEETQGGFTDEEWKDYKVNTDIQKLNDKEKFEWHEDDGVFLVADVHTKNYTHGYRFHLFRFDVPFTDVFNLHYLETVKR